MGIIAKIKQLFQKQTPKKLRNPVLDYDRKLFDRFYTNPNTFTLSYTGRTINNSEDMYEVYNSDSHFYSAFETLWDKICSLDWTIEEFIPDSYTKPRGVPKKAYDYIKRTINSLDINKLVRQMLKAQLNGKQVFQIFYKVNENGKVDVTNGYYEIDRIELCNPDFFDFDRDTGDLIYIEHRNWGSEINITKDYPAQFFVYAHNSSALNPHGESVIGKRGYLLYYLKRGFVSDFAIINELFSNPSFRAKINEYDNKGNRLLQDDTIEELYELANTIFKEMSKNKRHKIAYTNALDIDYLQPNMNNLVDLKSSWELINREISKLVLGSTKTNEGTETTGSYSQAEVHAETTEAKVEGICKELEGTINEVIKMLCQMNFGELRGYPKFHIHYRRDTVDMEEFDRVIQLLDRGLEVSKEWLYDKYKIQAPDDPNDSLTKQDKTALEEENLLKRIKTNGKEKANFITHK